MLDATVGSSTANSYVTLAESVEYFTNRAHSTAWEDEENKENMLITATSVLDWYVTWKGTRVDGVQALDWPRSGVYDKVGELYSELVIPQDVKIAVFEYALASLGTDRTADRDLAGLSEVRAGSLMIKADDGVYNTTPDTIPDRVRKIVSELSTKSGVGVVRLIRA